MPGIPLVWVSSSKGKFKRWICGFLPQVVAVSRLGKGPSVRDGTSGFPGVRIRVVGGLVIAEMQLVGTLGLHERLASRS
jgi:hypothetical protein